MADLQIQSTFKRSRNLEELIKKQFEKLQRFGQNIITASVYLKKEKKSSLSDIVTINLAIRGEKGVTVTVEDTLFEKSIKHAFTVARRNLKR